MSGCHLIGESGSLYAIESGKAYEILLKDVKEISSTGNLCLALTNRGTLYEISKINGVVSKVRLSSISEAVDTFSASGTHCIAVDETG